MSPPRLRVHWTAGALRDLECLATAKQSARVLLAMEAMARSGWSTGRRTAAYGHQAQYRSVYPLGVVYEVVGSELYVLHVLHGRQLRRLP